MGNTPFWYRFTPFLGRPPELTKHQWRLLGLLSAVSFFETYDIYLFSLNLAQIQAELLIAESDVGLLGAFVQAGSFLAPKYLQDMQGWEPSSVAMLSLAGGALAIVGNPLAGWLSDRFGRRPITTLFTGMFSLAAVAFYSLVGAFVPVLWIGFIFFMMGSSVTTTSYGTELFPTRYRSTATGFRAIVAAAAGILGLSTVSLLYPVFGSNWTSIAVLCAVSLIAPVMVWLFLPETAGRRLEEIAPD